MEKNHSQVTLTASRPEDEASHRLERGYREEGKKPDKEGSLHISNSNCT